MIYYPRIKNYLGERIDAVVEGNPLSEETVVLVHGLGTDKHETKGFFDDVSFQMGKYYRIARFDFSGCGKSEGRLEEKNIKEWGEDLKAVVSFVKEKYQGRTYLVAQSMGCFVAALSCPLGIEKTVFTGLPNTNTDFLIERLVERIESRPGGKVDFENITQFPRSSGKMQKIGPSFWKTLRLFDPLGQVKKYAQKTKLLIVRPSQDEIIANMYMSGYASIPKTVIKQLNGNHYFANIEDRSVFIKEAVGFFARTV